jgi:hypothetical protein
MLGYIELRYSAWLECSKPKRFFNDSVKDELLILFVRENPVPSSFLLQSQSSTLKNHIHPTCIIVQRLAQVKYEVPPPLYSVAKQELDSQKPYPYYLHFWKL